MEAYNKRTERKLRKTMERKSVPMGIKAWKRERLQAEDEAYQAERKNAEIAYFSGREEKSGNSSFFLAINVEKCK